MGAIEAIAARRELARQIAAALADLPAADLSGLDVARRVLAGGLDAAALLALQPELETATEQLGDLAEDSEKTVKRCLTLTPQPSPRLPGGF